MMADVPLGLFLSGGLDSTTIGYYMRRHSNVVRAFTIGFEEQGFDETEHAARPRPTWASSITWKCFPSSAHSTSFRG